MEGTDEIVYRKNLLEASVNIYLKKTCSILESFNRIRMLSTSHFEIHQIPAAANLTEELNKMLEMKGQMHETIIDKLKRGECEDMIDAVTEHRTVIWLMQTALVANSILYDQNCRKYFQQSKNLDLASSTTFPLSFQLLLQKLNQFSSWPFQHEICFEIESDQICIHNSNMVDIIEDVLGSKTTNGSLTELMCMVMSDVALESNSYENDCISPKLSLTNVPLHCRLSRLNQLKAMHLHLGLEYEGDAYLGLKSHKIAWNKLENSIKKFMLIISSLRKTCIADEQNTTTESKITSDETCENLQPSLSCSNKSLFSSSMEVLADFIASDKERKKLIDICKTVCPNIIIELLELCLNDIGSFVENRTQDGISLITAKLDIFTGLLVFQISSHTGKIDLAENLKHSADLVMWSNEQFLADIIAYDSCKTLLPATVLYQSDTTATNALNSTENIDKIIRINPAHDEQRASLGSQLKKGVTTKDSILAEMPTRHPSESFQMLSQELDQFKRSNLMDSRFLLDIQSELIHIGRLEESKDIELTFETLAKKIATWKNSIAKFTKHFRERYASFEDITLPILWSISTTVKGISLLMKRSEMRVYLPCKSNIINGLVELRDHSTRLACSSSIFQLQYGIPVDNVSQRLEITRLVHHSLKAKELQTANLNEGDEDSIMYKFNRDPDEDVFENESDGHLKKLSEQIDLNHSLQTIFSQNEKNSGVESFEFLEYYNKVMTNLKNSIATTSFLASNHKGKEIL